MNAYCQFSGGYTPVFELVLVTNERELIRVLPAFHITYIEYKNIKLLSTEKVK